MTQTTAPLPLSVALPATLTLGQRVIVMAPDTWLHRREGVIVATPRPSGLLHDPMVSVQIDGDTPLGHEPVRQLDPRRVAPASTCDTCSGGCDCDCEGGIDGIGCGHWACWGRASTHTCPGVAPEYLQAEAYKVARGWTA